MPDLRDRNSRVVQQRAREIVNEAFLATLRDDSGPDGVSDADIDESFENYDMFVRSLDERADMGDFDVDYDYDYNNYGDDYDYDYNDYGDDYHRFEPEF